MYRCQRTRGLSDIMKLLSQKCNNFLIEPVKLYSMGHVFSLYGSCAAMSDTECCKMDAFIMLYLEILAISSGSKEGSSHINPILS